MSLAHALAASYSVHSHKNYITIFLIIIFAWISLGDSDPEDIFDLLQNARPRGYFSKSQRFSKMLDPEDTGRAPFLYMADATRRRCCR